MFCVGDWFHLDSKGRPVWRNKNYGVNRNFSEFGKYTYRDNSGKFIVDVFVFSNYDENRIVQTLEDLVKVNQTDHELISQLKSLVDKQRPLNLLAHSKEIQK